MQSDTDHKALARWLADLLQQGIAVTDDVAAYMAATFGETDLAALLAKEADAEIDSLLELIFYPGLEVQLRYESRWGDRKFSPDHQSEVQALLCRTPMAVPLLGGESTKALSITPPDFALEAYVQRLNITWQIDTALAGTIAASWPGRSGLLARVHLRNTSLALHEHQIGLMTQFFSKAPAETESLEKLLPLLLSILPELQSENDFFEFLMAKKFFYFQSLCKAEDFERRRQGSNMEIMMLQGNRSAYGSIDEWRRNMLHIDIISRHLFGHTHFFQQPGNACIDLEAGDSAGHINAVMRALS